jgi:23S rRNA pseudouridine2605 synthase
MKIKLNKYVAKHTNLSRRKSESLIRDNKVKLNNKIVNNPLTMIDPDTDTVQLKNNVIKKKIKKYTYILFYKPVQCITSKSDEKNRLTVMEFMTKIKGWKTLFPVGRLDYNTEGLLLLTNDGDYANRVIHPSHKINKTYTAKVKGVPSRKIIEKMIKGVKLKNDFIKCNNVRILQKLKKNSWVEITLQSGQNRIIRRLCSYINHPVINLIRTGIGGINYKQFQLLPGQYKILNQIEKDLVFK